MHEQKMHYLHEFHRQQLHAKDHRIAAMEAEKKAVQAERLAGMYSEKVGHAFRPDLGRNAEGGEGEQNEKEREMWRIMGSARPEGDGSGSGGEDGRGGKE